MWRVEIAVAGIALAAFSAFAAVYLPPAAIRKYRMPQALPKPSPALWALLIVANEGLWIGGVSVGVAIAGNNTGNNMGVPPLLNGGDPLFGTLMFSGIGLVTGGAVVLWSSVFSYYRRYHRLPKF